MDRSKPPAVILGTFELPSGRVCSVGDSSWYRWLDSEGARSFRFEGKAGTFTARKEVPSNGNPYWMANRRINGQLRKGYLGNSGKLDIDYLESAAARLADPEYQSLSKVKSAAKEASSGKLPPISPEFSLATHPDFLRLQEQIKELQEQVKELLLRDEEEIGALGQFDTLQADNQESEQRKSELSDRLADLTARAELAFAANSELRRQVTELARERDTLTEQVTELARERDTLTEQVTELARERDALTRQLAEARAESAELSRRNSELAGKVGDLDLQRQELREQLAATVAERDTLSRQLAEKDSVAEAQLRTGTPAATESAPPPDLPALRARVLAGLKLGRQAPGYRAAAKALSEFVRELELELPAPTGTS